MRRTKIQCSALLSAALAVPVLFWPELHLMWGQTTGAAGSATVKSAGEAKKAAVTRPEESKELDIRKTAKGKVMPSTEPPPTKKHVIPGTDPHPPKPPKPKKGLAEEDRAKQDEVKK